MTATPVQPTPATAAKFPDPAGPARTVTAAPPYSLEQVQFSVPALADSAQLATLGGDREMALAAVMVARLMMATLPPASLPEPERAMRAERVRGWLSALTMPQPARMAFLRSVDASITGGIEAAASLRELMGVLTGHLAPAAALELGALAERLHLYYEQTP